MFTRITFLLAVVSLLATGLACNQQPKTLVGNPNDTAPNPQPVQIGAPLYAPVELQPVARPPAFASEPILIPSHLVVIDKRDIPSQRDSTILFIGTEVPDVSAVADKDKLFKQLDHNNVEKYYRPLEAGDDVQAGQVVVLLDDREARAALQGAAAAAKASEDVHAQTVAMLQSYTTLFKQKKGIYDKGELSLIEYIQAQVELNRATAQETSARADMIKAKEDHNKARINYEFFTIRSPISGTIQPFNRKSGESVKALEMVLQIQGSERLRAEGVVATGNASRVRRGMPVTIEPTVEVAPAGRRRFHTQAINGVAVSNHPNRPFIVTVSDDKTARVWDGRSDYEAAILTHKVSVRSVACSPPGSKKHYCLTGSDDSKGRIWDLNNPKNSEVPLQVLEGAHSGVISAVAFSPDGRYCATADSRDIAIWESDSGKLLYKLPAYHLGEITSVTFTPQAKLVSASRDMTLRLWSLGREGARLDKTFEGRSGDVGRLGVSHDGRYVIADLSQSLQLISLADRRTEGSVENINDSSKFASFAIFSQDNKYIVAGNQSEGRISVWRAPTAGNRATELRQFVPRERLATFTCVAVSQTDKEPFAVTGTKNGEVHVWPMPSDTDVTRVPGVLRFIDQTTNSATKQVRVWAEFPNSSARLQAGTNVTIVAEPNPAK